MSQPPEFYALNPQNQTATAHDGGVYILGETNQRHSSSALLGDVLAEINSAKTAQSLIERFPQHPAAHIYFALNMLIKENIVLRHAQEPDLHHPSQPATLNYDDFDVVAQSKVAAAFFQSALGRAGLFPNAQQTSRQPKPLRVVLSADYLCEWTLSQIEICQKSHIRMLPVKLIGVRSYFGPTLSGESGVCISCLLTRLRSNRPIENHLNEARNRPFGFSDPLHAPLSAQAKAVADAAIEVIKSGSSIPDLVEINENGRRTHPTQNLLACPNCVPKPCPEATAFDWGQASDIVQAQGGYRSRAPSYVIEKLAPLVSDLTGLISGVGPLTFDPSAGERHVWAATYPITPTSPTPTGEDFHSTAMGKGVSPEQAHASVICEAVERISAQALPSRILRKASFAELAETAIPPNSLWNFSAQQIQSRDAWNATTSDTRRHIPPPLDPGAPHHWAPVWSLTHNQQKWMLRELCYINAPQPHYGRFDPNGCAAGATLEEAALQGALELVERDCIAIWWYNRLPRPGLDPAQSSDPNLRALAAGFAAQGWDSWLLDLTNDLKIPCFAAIARASSDGRWCIGFGAHLEWSLAAERAMSELAQMFRADGRDGPPPWAQMDEADAQYLHPDGQATPQNAPIPKASKIGDLITWFTQHLADRNIELLILDQTRPDAALPVVKMFAPGLRHFWPRLAPGRLYDVPVEMGWLPQSKSESDLNPVHLFL